MLFFKSWTGKMHKHNKQGICLLRILVAQTAISALLAAGAQAASLANIDGVILVNHGNGFKPVAEGAALASGDRVRAAAGSADVLYENGCSTKVAHKRTVVVLFTPPACGQRSLKDGVSAGGGSAFSLPPEVIGAGVVLGGAGLAVALSHSGSNTFPGASQNAVRGVSP
jgi:hypothetical protein